MANVTLTSPDLAVGEQLQVQIVNGDGVIFLTIIGAAGGGGGGTVTDVTGTDPIVVTNSTTTPNVAILPATDADAGSMSAADKTKLDALAAGTFTSVANATALTAVANASFPLGAIAFVQSYGAYFALSPTQTLRAAIVLAAADGRTWVRTETAIAPAALAQTTWIIDPAAGNDEATGLTTLTALKTFAELVRRWGTSSPLLAADTTVQWNSSAPSTDPVVVSVPFEAAGELLLTNNGLTPTQTTTITAFTAKNRSAATLNTITAAGVASWAALVGALVHDTTAGATFFIDRDAGGGVAEITEPLQTSSITSLFGPSAQAIANTDTIQIFAPATLPTIFMPAASSVCISGSFTRLTVQGLTINSEALVFVTGLTMAECIISPPAFQPYGQQFTLPILSSCRTSVYQGAAQIFGGSLLGAGSQLLGPFTLLDGDVIVRQRVHPRNNAQLVLGCVYFGEAPEYEDGPASWVIQASSFGPGGTHGVLWGPGPTNVSQGATFHIIAGTAANSLVSTGGLQLDGVATGYTFTLATGTFSAGAVALTPAALDTNASFQNPRSGSRFVVG